MSSAVKQFHEEEAIGKTYDFQVARRLLRYLKPYMRLLVPAILLTFVVHHTYSTEKTAFPSAVVYGPTPLSELRLVTCGGDFDRVAGSYRNNVIVEAVLKV